jgi:transcription factor Ssl1
MSLHMLHVLLLLPGRCKGRVVELPCSCHICGLTLVSSPHLARSFHHLFPVHAFAEVPPAEVEALTVSALLLHACLLPAGVSSLQYKACLAK